MCTEFNKAQAHTALNWVGLKCASLRQVLVRTGKSKTRNEEMENGAHGNGRHTLFEERCLNEK